MSKVKQHAAERAEPVADFDPSVAGSSAHGWLLKVETFARTHHWSEDQTYSYARGKLLGPAKDWLSTAKVCSWPDFRVAFRDTFADRQDSSGGSLARKHRALERRKKLPNESVDEYLEAMIKSGKRLKLPEEIVVAHFVTGLDDPVLSKVIPVGTGLQQLKKAVAWQREVGLLMQQYTDSELTVDSFERLADKMESIVLDGTDNLVQMISCDADTLKPISGALSALLRQHRSSVSASLFDLGTSKTHQIVVHLEGETSKDTHETRPVEAGGLPGVDRRLLQSSIISHLTCDVIMQSPSSPNPCCAADFTGADIWLDLAPLNATCCKESPNLLLPRQLLPALSAFRYFTILDFAGGHLQIPIAPESRHHFTFTSALGSFQFRRAPRNFTNTTIIFNKILIELARKLAPGDLVVLNDLLLVPAHEPAADGLVKLARVLAAIGAFGLTVDLRRSRFFDREAKLFNWIVRHGQVISIGPPFEPGQAGSLSLVIKLSAPGSWQTFLLRRNAPDTDGGEQTVGCFFGVGQPTAAEHLVDSVEHFTQFLQFAPFEVVVPEDTLKDPVERRTLSRVQQYDFVIKIGNSPQ